MVQAFALEIAPFFILAAVLVQAIFNSSTSLVAKFYNISIHPTLSGKLSTMFAWFTLCTFAIHKLLTVGDPSDSTILAAGYLFFALFAGLGIVASINYFGQLRARS